MNITPATEPELLHSRNILLAGTSVVSGEGRAVVFATGALTELVVLCVCPRATMQSLHHCVGSWLISVDEFRAIFIELVLFVVGDLIALPFWEDFIFSIGIIIAMVPEGLLPTVAGSGRSADG